MSIPQTKILGSVRGGLQVRLSGVSASEACAATTSRAWSTTGCLRDMIRWAAAIISPLATQPDRQCERHCHARLLQWPPATELTCPYGRVRAMRPGDRLSGQVTSQGVGPELVGILHGCAGDFHHLERRHRLATQQTRLLDAFQPWDI